MKKLFENWNVSVLKDEIYVVNIITTSKSIYLDRKYEKFNEILNKRSKSKLCSLNDKNIVYDQ